MKKSKKGMTLVELVICCGVLVMLAGACTTVLLAGHHLYSGGSDMANVQIEANVVQNFILTELPAVKTVSTVTVETAKDATEGTYLYFDGDLFIINADGKKTTMSGVTGFTGKFLKAGDSVSADARAQFFYTATMEGGGTFSGGLVLSNMQYSVGTMEDGTGATLEFDAKDAPIAFDVPEDEE